MRGTTNRATKMRTSARGSSKARSTSRTAAPGRSRATGATQLRVASGAPSRFHSDELGRTYDLDRRDSRPPGIATVAGSVGDSSGSAGVSDDAAAEHHEAGEQPGYGVQVLIASARGRGMPAGRARPGTLDPCDVQQESRGAGEQAERRAADRRPRRHQRAGRDDRHEQQYAE